MKVVGYIRVSTLEQAKSGLGLANQEAKVRALASAMDYKLVDILDDRGFSGKSLRRPGMKRLLELMQGKKIDGVIILRLDRLTRSVRDLGFLLDKMTAQKVALISVQDSINTDTASGKLIVHVLGAISQWEREMDSERISAALHVKRERREKLGGAVPYGYKIVEGTSGRRIRLEPEPREQAALKLMRDLREQGKSLRKIAAELLQQGYMPRKAQAWSAECIKEILNRKYWPED